MNYLLYSKKSLGQNFLIDKNIINKIIKIGDIKKNSIVLEIGPGYGNLTRGIIDASPKKIFAVEKDTHLTNLLKNNFKNHKNIEITNKDILKVIEEDNFKKNVIIFGNLPYNISTKILASLILLKKWPPSYKILIFMFQKEVADRIIAKQNSSNYGRLAILCNWRLEIKKHFNVSQNSFYPKPKIRSTILSFVPKEKNSFNIKNPKNLEMITRKLFSNRRKMINKNFLKLFNNNKFIAEELDLELSKRPGELSNEMFYRITMKYEELFG